MVAASRTTATDETLAITGLGPQISEKTMMDYANLMGAGELVPGKAALV